MTVYVTADRSRVVRMDDPEAAFGVAEADIDSLGLRAALDAFEAPEQLKELPKPNDKAAKRPLTK